MEKNKKRFILWGILSLFLAFSLISLTNVSASLGITPADIEVNFQPNMHISQNFRIMGASPEQKIEVYAEGDLAKYVIIDNKEIIGQGSFHVEVNLPAIIETPGRNIIRIGIREMTSEEGGVGTKLAVEGGIIINVPYPGKYAEISQFIFNDINSGESIGFFLEINNLGTEAISTATAVEVYSGEEKLRTFDLGTKYIETQTKAVFEKSFDSQEIKAGVYNATAMVNYGGKETLELKKVFRVGTLFVNITNWTNEFEKGKINPFEIEIESQWNNGLNNIYAEVNVTDNGKEIDFFKTPSAFLKPWEKIKLRGFFNAENSGTGTHQAEITLFYEGEKTEKTVDIKLARPSKENLIWVIGFIGGILLLITIGVIIFFIKKRKKNVKKR